MSAPGTVVPLTITVVAAGRSGTSAQRRSRALRYTGEIHRRVGGQVGPELNHLAERSAAGTERRLEVPEGGLDLKAEVSGAHQRTAGVE